jgi:sporulation protein YlmC with PRC-barrel domain
MTMDLVRDLLDKLVVDRHGREIGRADNVVVEIRANAPPRVVAIEIGPSVLACRLRPLLGRWMRGLEHALDIAEGRPLRIPFGDILDARDRIKVDRAAGETVAAALEHRLRKWISMLPGSS